MATLITPPYSFKEVADGKTYIHVNDGTDVALYVDDVPQATAEIVGPLVLNATSQVSGLPVANRTLFEIWKKLLKPATFISPFIFNDTFDADIGIWIPARASSVLSIVAGRLRITADSTATNGGSREMTGLIIGNNYNIKAEVFSDLAGETVRFRVDTEATLYGSIFEQSATNADFTVDTTFTATATTMYCGTIVTGSNTGTYHELDNVSLKAV